MRYSPFTNYAFLLLALIVTGCSGQDWRAELLPLSGKLLINGQPHEGIYVILVSTGGHVDIRESRPWGVTDHEGNYQLTTYERGDGGPHGDFSVTVRWPVVRHRVDSEDRLFEKFSSPQNSVMTFTIDKNTKALPPIELKGVKFLKQDSFPKDVQFRPGSSPNVKK
jgi:hypothetical protein